MIRIAALLFGFYQLVLSQTYDAGFSAPVVPRIFASTDHNLIQLNWDDRSLYSIDSLTGYADFEGFRIYKSLDGGLTWGDEDDKIYDFEGNFIGWEPLAQFDLTLNNDSLLCIYTYAICQGENTRGEDISGYSEINPRIFLGSNSGIEFSYKDENVIDGVEYTYTVTAYDMGLKTSREVWTPIDTTFIDSVLFRRDTVWSSSNPDHYISLSGGDYPSLESPKGTHITDDNFITLIPGYRASNITFPSKDNFDDFMKADENLIGTGDKSFSIIEIDSLSDALLKFEIQADMASNALMRMKTKKPSLFIYDIQDTVNELPVYVNTYWKSNLSRTEIDSLFELPGVDTTGIKIIVPRYRITYGSLNVWTDYIDGVRFQFVNRPENFPGNNLDVTDSIYWFVQDSTSINLMYTVLTYFSKSVYSMHPNFDYRIDFSTSALDTVRWVAPSSNCSDLPTKTVLPFKITNLTTGKKVTLQHTDKGVFSGGGSTEPGYGDCLWTRNEEIGFRADSLLEGIDTEYSAHKTYKLKINFNIFGMLGTGFKSSWNPVNSYSEGDRVLFDEMLYEAIVPILPGVEPIAWIDNNEDDINDNPWKVQYPWSDGDYAIISPIKSFIDGDFWIVDMSLLGKSHNVTKDELNEIKVVPNPYLVHSKFNETSTSRRLQFIHLPQRCRITIYTLNGEIVDSFQHNDEYDGSEYWDMKSDKGFEISPGLYIYVVESDDYQHIGKFAVVR